MLSGAAERHRGRQQEEMDGLRAGAVLGGEKRDEDAEKVIGKAADAIIIFQTDLLVGWLWWTSPWLRGGQ